MLGGMRINREKSENKYKRNEYRYFIEANFLEVNWLFVLTYSKNVNASERHNSFRYYFPKPFFDDYNIIINGKSFSDQPIDSDIKPYDKVRKVITRQGEDYTTGCL